MMNINRFNAEVKSNKLQYFSIEHSRMTQLKLKILVFFLLLTLAAAVGNDTNGTAPPPPDNTTNNTNATSPPSPPAGNETNGTNNNTGVPGNQTNSTMNNTMPGNSTNSSMNGTGPGNATNPPMNGTGGNDTNSSMNGSGPGNATNPPMNGTGGNDTNSSMNGTGPGNMTNPPMNGTGGNNTNSSMNGTGPGNMTNPPMNGTGGNNTNSSMNGTGPGNTTNATMNGTGPGNATNPPTNGTGPGNTTNSSMNGTGPGNGTNSTMNGTGPGNATNSSMNGTGPGNGTTPPMNGTGAGNSTNSSMNGTGSNNTTNSSMMVTPNANFAPPPPINSSVLLVLNKSGDGMFIGSKRLESLQLVLNPGNATNGTTTTFILNSFSSAAGSTNNSAIPSNNKQFSQPGNWTYVTGTRDTLSCSLVYDFNSGSFGLVQYVADRGDFSMVFRSAGSIFSNTTNVTIQVARNTTILRENCGTLYQTSLTGQNITLFRLTASALVPVALPAGWTVRSSSEWIQYGVASNIMYRFNSQNGTFAPIYTFPQSQAYAIRNAQGRLLVVAANMSAGNNTTTYYQRKYLFQINSTSISLITQFQYTAMMLVVGNMTAPPIFPYFASPMLTKLGVVYNTSNSTSPIIIMKSIDSNTNSVTNLTFQEPRRFLATIGTMPIDGPKFFGDYFFVVRNDSAYPIANTSFVEEAYQFVGSQVNFLRNRILTSNDSNGFLNTYIDATIPNQLVVLNTKNVAEGVAIEQFLYGNIATVNKVVPPTIPAFISFIIASGGVAQTPAEPTSPLSWVYVNPSGNNTNITVIQTNSSFPNNVRLNTNTLPGSLTVISMNSYCIITRDITNNSLSIASFPPAPANASQTASANSSAPFVIQDINSLMANITLTNTTKWGLSDRCERFSVDNKVFFRAANQSTYQPITNNISAFNPTAFSRNLDAALAGNSIWLLSANGNSFTRAFESNKTFLPNSKIYRKEARIIVAGNNGTAAQVVAYYFQSTGMFTNCLDYFFPLYQSAPKIQISSQLSKVLVMGPFIAPNQTQMHPHFDSFFISFPNRTSLNISFPLDKVADPVNSFVLLDDQFLYIRSLSTSNFSNSSNSTVPKPQENVFFISRDVTPLLASSVNLTQAQLTQWRRSGFSAVEDGKMKIYIETSETVNSTNFVVVNVKQVSGQQATLNSDSSQGVTGVVDSAGKIKLCGTGCSDCSTGTCTGCSTRFVFDSSSSQCFACGPNCATCSSTNYKLCYSCISHTYLSNSTCLPCDSSCVDCSSATTCTSCPPGQNLAAGQCNATCPKNCITCNGTTCLTCISGFVVANGSCRGCVASCSNCSTTNITQCTSCAPGLTLVNSACIPCPDKCQTCSSGVCATCIPGFSPNANGVCVLACQISCATCADNQPSVCLSCYSGAYLSGSSCVLNTTCNTDLSCTDCGQGLGYILVGSQCVQCTTISNCLQCNTANTEQCSKCMNGYYLDSLYLCQSCPSSCLTCNSADVCTGCVVGYTLAQNQTEGQCLACQSPCASCLGVSTYCLSCVDGYTKKGWKCQSNKYVGFSMILVGAAPADVLNTIDTLLQLILNACRLTDSSAITFTTITSGSTSVSGTTTSSDPATTSSSLSSALVGGSLGSYTVGSVSVSTNGVDGQESKSNAGMIAGIVIGVVVLVTGAVIIAYIVYKKKQASQIISQEGQIAIEMENAPVMKNDSKLSAENYGLRANSAEPQEVNIDSHSQNAWEKEVF